VLQSINPLKTIKILGYVTNTSVLQGNYVDTYVKTLENRNH
jgi:hypothetical protein